MGILLGSSEPLSQMLLLFGHIKSPMCPFTLTSCAEAERSSLMLVLATSAQAFLELLLSEIFIPQIMGYSPASECAKW
ncbi:hypothetical protein P5673_002916 [Acropora cervicornis]|uniref:Uncharacterized protein n=1 Tax=Acropora cervicornis TaxID=6130 RepID=A0AAD9R1S3_ACRCE|nr:hypothetical protein P5673_002916 [Acropora cervicornis]